MHPAIRAGAEIRIAHIGDDQTQAWIHYMLDVDGGVFARTVPLYLKPTEAQPGSQDWTKQMLIQLIEAL